MKCISKIQGKSCEDIISKLRNGSAAENAVAKMHERGLLAPRRSRHRLTPGTVKFAAFHVLSLEGDKGLTVLELAEKIQVCSYLHIHIKRSFVLSGLFLTSYALYLSEIWSSRPDDQQDT